MAKYLTYDELMKLALEYYNEGGDITFETVNKESFEKCFSKLTKKQAINMFRIDKELFYEC